jgi:Homeodomain-like domain
MPRRHPLLQVHLGEQLPRPHIRAPHPCLPKIAQTPNHIRDSLSGGVFQQPASVLALLTKGFPGLALVRISGMTTESHIQLSPEDRAALEAWVAGRNTPQKLVWRARIVLMWADGAGITSIIKATGRTKRTAYRWRDRYLERGMEGLRRDASRPPPSRTTWSTQCQPLHLDRQSCGYPQKSRQRATSVRVGTLDDRFHETGSHGTCG